jgi:hypothetical protein
MKNDPDHPFCSNKFNVCGSGEVIGFGEEFECDLFFIKDLDVHIGDEWIDMREAFKNHNLIVDNSITYFFEPANEEDRARGFALNYSKKG